MSFLQIFQVISDFLGVYEDLLFFNTHAYRNVAEKMPDN